MTPFAKIKAWTPLVVGILAFLGSMYATYMQTKSVDKKSIAGLTDSLNATVISPVQSSINKLYDENQELRERIVRLETLLNEKFKKMPVPVLWGEDALPMASKPVRAKRDLPKIQKMQFSE